MKKKTVQIVGSQSEGYVIRARVNGRKILITGKLGSYSSDASARRAWRKFAVKNQIENVVYQRIED